MDKKTKIVDIIFILIILFLAVLLLKPEPHIKEPPNVVLSRFIDLYDKNVTNVEIWLENIGDKDAYNISVYVRCRNQNGTILFNNTVPITSYYLRPNETCSGVFSFNFDNSTKLYYTVEIRWNNGMKSYFIEKIVNYLRR